MMDDDFCDWMLDDFSYSANDKVCNWLDNLYSDDDRERWVYEYEHDTEYVEWQEAQLRNRKELRKEAHFNKMWNVIPNITDTPYEAIKGEVKYIPATTFWWMLFKQYDTKIVLCGDYVKVYRYDRNSREEAYRHDTKTGKVKKYYDHNSWSKKDRFIDWALTNEKVFKTWLTLTFKDIDDVKEARRVFGNWVKTMKRKTKKKSRDFYYMMAIEKGSNGDEKIHIHLLSSLDINDDEEMFVKSDNKDRKWDHEYKFIGWKHGGAVAYPIRTSMDHLFISIYNSKGIDFRVFNNTRNSSKSQNLDKPKVFVYNSNKEQKKIDVLLKDTEEIRNKQYKDYFGRDTKTELYKRGKDIENELGWVVGLSPTIDDPFR